MKIGMARYMTSEIEAKLWHLRTLYNLAYERQERSIEFILTNYGPGARDGDSAEGYLPNKKLIKYSKRSSISFMKLR